LKHPGNNMMTLDGRGDFLQLAEKVEKERTVSIAGY
jgi:hypothetical protein